MSADVSGPPLDGVAAHGVAARGVENSSVRDSGVEADGDGLRIGAAVRDTDLAAHPLVRERYPLLARAVLRGGLARVRDMATVAGNLLQRPRCLYYQDVSQPCNKRLPGSGCPAIAGDHGDLAVLGHSDTCVAIHPSDMAVALTALDAGVLLTGPDGDRVVRMPGLHRLPGSRPDRDTRLEPGEVITAVTLPPPRPGASRYRKARERPSSAFALVSLAAILDVAGDGTVHDCRIVLGGVAHAPWRAFRAEQALRGSRAAEDSFVAAAEAEMEQARPLPRNAHKVPLARDLIIRTLLELAG
ncbi:FAD binding domain-containing protein [Sphaerisporangium dianthi]|uniref:FAD binding domain-containing protein n=1 Tax=Sphaerisporangium dianthi TaxID=1436120 RepID=A0ABV9CKV1_9ACTN